MELQTNQHDHYLARKRRFPPALRWALIGSLAAHILVVGGLIFSTLYESRARPIEQHAIVTKLVRLGKERPKDLMPRLDTPPPPPTDVAKSIKAVAPLTQPKPKSAKEIAHERAEEMSKVSSALDRLKSKAEKEGSKDGSTEGETSDLTKATLGNKFASEVYRCMKANYDVMGLNAAQLKGRQATVLVRVANNGSILEARIMQTSGLPRFDAAVQRAINLCKQVSPPDAEIRDDMRKHGIELVFQP